MKLFHCGSALPLFTFFTAPTALSSELHTARPLLSRRNWMQHSMFSFVASTYSTTLSADANSLDDIDHFSSAAFSRQEYTNSITASRNTNISPKEVYDTLERLQRPPANANTEVSQDGITKRALDVGAGAGVSTQVLWNMGYHNIDAIDWSGEAWQVNVVEAGHCAPYVHFYQLDDERFLRLWRERQLPRYDVISFNFAINLDKAMEFLELLQEPGGLLLAPVNVHRDYWLKQDYQLYGQDGKLRWSSSDVGAWSVLFQPDVTSETCQGIWCPQFNGFQRLQQSNR